MILFSTFVSLCLQEAKVNKEGKAPHSKWRNYDDMNEYFWYYLLICRLSKNVLEVV
jgi:callose synthase